MFEDRIAALNQANTEKMAMGAIQYEPMISGFKFWIAFVVIVCVMIYIVAMVSSMQKKNILIGQSVKSNFRKNDGKQEA